MNTVDTQKKDRPVENEVMYMELTKNEFEVLKTVATHTVTSQRELAGVAQMSLGTVNSALRRLVEQGYVDTLAITERGMKALEPYKVENAIIMAAGLSSRFAPISYEKPKGLLTVKGEVLIERQIRQLHDAGITNISVVVGYKKEFFFYLEDKFNVSIIINDEFASRNNNSTLMVAADKLSNTFICSSDDYFTENPFELYVYKAYYAGEYVEGPTKEWCFTTGAQKRIVDVTVGGFDSWVMLGHAYFDKVFSEHFVSILKAEYDRPETVDKYWEDLFIEHIKEFDMVMRPYGPGIIYEFDSLDELRVFDPYFLENVDSEVFDNIVNLLGCSRNDICDVYPLKQGLTNLSCHFRVGDNEYVYRHPGVGTEALIDRSCEQAAQSIAHELGLDNTFMYEDKEKGWKVSRFVTNCRQLDPRNKEDLTRAMEMGRILHNADVRVDGEFDFHERGKYYESLVEESQEVEIPGYAENSAKIDALHEMFLQDESKICLCHNDFFCLNFLISQEGEMSLIDWEYAGMADSSQDYATFVVCCELEEDEADDALEMYLDHKPSNEERRHHYASIAFAGWCWYVWSLYKELQGEFVGEWLYVYYRYAKKYYAKAAALYGITD